MSRPDQIKPCGSNKKVDDCELQPIEDNDVVSNDFKKIPKMSQELNE